MSLLTAPIRLAFKTSKRAYLPSEVIRLELTIGNFSELPLELRFLTTQQYEFLIMRGGNTVWRWSRNKLFANIPRVVQVPAGGSAAFEETVPAMNLGTGVFEALGVLTTDPPARAETRFRIVRQRA